MLLEIIYASDNNARNILNLGVIGMSADEMIEAQVNSNIDTVPVQFYYEFCSFIHSSHAFLPYWTSMFC